MATTSRIKHRATISKITPDALYIKLSEQTHCDMCQFKSSCGTDHKTNQIIKIKSSSESYKLNEKVYLTFEKKMGLKAVFIAYVFPFLILLISLIISSLFLSDKIAGILVIMLLSIYFGLLYFFREKLDTEFNLKLTKS